jgi:hypothetical protein
MRLPAPGALRSGLLVGGLVALLAGCASQSLIPAEQAAAIERRDRALAAHAAAIQDAIRQSGEPGGLAFLDETDGRLIVLPGPTPADAWARHAAAPADAARPASIPAIATFVHRADVAAAPQVVSTRALGEQHALRTAMTALETEVREAQRRTDERLTEIQRELTRSVDAVKQETDRSAAAVADLQRSLRSLADDLAAARTFMLQTAQLGWLNHELTVENASGIRKVEAASQSLTATSGRLAATLRQHSEALARQLKELGDRLEAIRAKMSDTK